MLGAMIGDIAGSVYEFAGIKTKDFPLFAPRASYTDDSVMTAAVFDALCQDGITVDTAGPVFTQTMRWYARHVPIDPAVGGYGGGFRNWLSSPDPQPYNSWGNGSAMRVSAVGWLFDTVDEVEAWAKASAAVSHNHPEGIKGAQAIAVAIFLARTGSTRSDIKATIEQRYGYKLNRSLDQIRPTYRFNESCQGTVPEAITAWLESDSFEDAIRNAVSLGGDADTLAAITGSIAEAEYEVPTELEQQARKILHPVLRATLARFDACVHTSVPIGDPQGHVHGGGDVDQSRVVDRHARRLD